MILNRKELPQGALFINLGGLIVFAVKFEEALSVATGLTDFRCLGTDDEVVAVRAFPNLNFALLKGFFASSFSYLLEEQRPT